ncbi:hypothetical protein [Desulfobacula sp.]|uniref:hypothetical protein n=1 Tax=Desulfobacula sp. TaxID=2593537 RepID=UPI00260E2FCC|nr:hypothetical protein [Desulfobacula sp.]
MKKAITGILVFIALIGLSMLGQDSDDTIIFYTVNTSGLLMFLGGAGLACLVSRKK